MTARDLQIAPQLYARVCGALYLYIIIAGMLAEFIVRSRLVSPADAAATARNIMANELLFRIGFSGELLHLTFDVGVATILYALLKPIHRNVALLAAFMRLACDTILAVVSISHFAALRLLADTDYLKVFQPDQLNALALLALKLHGDGYAISLAFFGFACLALGYLIFKSSYLPRTIGLLLAIAGICYLFINFAHFLAPAFATTLFPALFVPIFIAELSLSLWLLVKGADMPEWEKRTSTVAHSGT